MHETQFVAVWSQPVHGLIQSTHRPTVGVGPYPVRQEALHVVPLRVLPVVQDWQTVSEGPVQEAHLLSQARQRVGPTPPLLSP